MTDGPGLFTVARGADVVEQLHAETTAIPGRPGWRRDVQGREWYSAAWLDEGAWEE
jgi:hypothetical protein